MPSTREAIAILVIAVLPGLLYTLSYEREVGSWGVHLADRILRLIAASAIFQAILAWPLYEVWSKQLAGEFESTESFFDELRGGERCLRSYFFFLWSTLRSQSWRGTPPATSFATVVARAAWG